MGKGKKFLSLFLAAAMAVTGINVGVPTIVQAAEAEIAGMPERLAYFSFDQGTMNEDGTIVSADDGMVSGDNGASTSVTASVVGGDASISDDAESKVGTGALKLSNNAYLKVTGLGLENQEAVTVSCWARLSAAANNQWIFSASQPVSGAGTRAVEQYVGMMYGADGKSVLAYRSKDAVIDSSDAASTQDGEPASIAEGTEEFDGTAWHYVTFVMGAQDGKLYLDGKLVGEIPDTNSLATILGQNGELYIGANPALNQFFNGFVDEFTVYADAMTEAQVQEKYESYLDEETTKAAVVKYVVDINGEKKDLQAEADTTLTFDEAKKGYFYTLTDEDKRIVSTVADAEGVEEKVYRPISVADVKAEPGDTANDPYVVTVNYQLSTKKVSVACAEQPVSFDNINHVTILDQDFFDTLQEIEEAPELDENNESVYLYDISKAPKQIKYEGENGKVLYVLAPISEQLYLAPNTDGFVTVLYKEADKTKEATVKYVAEIGGELTELQEDKANGTISLDDQLEYTYTLTEDEERVLSAKADPNGQIQKVYRPVENPAKVEAQADGSYVVTITYALSVNSGCSLWPVGEGGTIEDLIETEDFAGIDVECEEAVDLKDGEPVYVYYVQSSDMPVEITDTNGEVYIRQVEENTPIAADEMGFIYVPYKKKTDTKEFTLKYTCGTNTVTETAYFDVDGDNYVYTIPEDKKLVPVEADPKVYVPDVTDRVLTVSKADAETTTELSVPCKLSTQKATVNYVSGSTVVKEPKTEVDVQEYKEANGSYVFKYALVTSGADREDKLVGKDGKVYVVADNANMNAVLENGKYVVNIEYKLSQQKATVKFVSNGKSLKADKEVSLVETAEGKFIYTLAEGEDKIEAEGKFYVPVADQSLEAVKTGDDYVVTVNYELSKKKVDIAYQCGETVVKTEKDVEFTETAKDQYTYSLEAGKVDGTDGVRYSYEAAELTAGKDDTKVTVACTKSVKKVTIEFTVPEDRFTFTKEYEFNETTDDSITYTLPEKIEHEGKMYLPQETELTLGMDDDEYWVDCERSTKDVTVKFFRMEGETETEITSETYKFQETVEGAYTYTLSDTTKVTDEESGKVYVPKSFDELSVAADAESFEVKVECVNSKVTVTVHYMYGEGEDAVELDTELKEFEETVTNVYTYAYAELKTIPGQEEGVAYVPKPENEQTKLTAERSEDGKKWEITAFYNQVVSKDVEVTFVSGEGENEVEVAKETVKFVKGEDGKYHVTLPEGKKVVDDNRKVYKVTEFELTAEEDEEGTLTARAACEKSTQTVTVSFQCADGEDVTTVTKEMEFEEIAAEDETAENTFEYTLSDTEKRVEVGEAGIIYIAKTTELTAIKGEDDTYTAEVACEKSTQQVTVKYVYEEGDITESVKEDEEVTLDETKNGFFYDYAKADAVIPGEEGISYILKPEAEQNLEAAKGEDGKYVVTLKYDKKVSKNIEVEFVCSDAEEPLATQTLTFAQGEDGTFSYKLDADTKFIWNGKVYRPDNLNLTATEETKITVSCTKSTKQITVDFVYGEGETDKITKEVTFEETEDGKFTASLSKVSNEAGEVYTPTETEKTVEADVTTTTVTCERSKILVRVEYMFDGVKLGEGSEEFPETTANVYTYDLTKAPEELTDEAGVVYIPSAEGQDLTAKQDAENHQYVVTVLYEKKVVDKKFTVKFQCGDVVVKDAIEVSLVKGEDGKYTYEPAAEDAVVTKDGKTYVRIENPDAWSVGEDVTEILVSYKENDVKEVVGTYETTTRVNVAPELPETVTVKMDDNTEAQAGVTWTIAPEDYAELGEKTIHGTITGKDIEVTLTLKVVTVEGLLMADYSFDEDELSDGVHPDNAERNGEKVATVNSVDGLKGKAVQLPGGTNGAGGSVHLPDDLLQIDGQTQDDFTISMFMKRETVDNSFALTLHANEMMSAGPRYIGLVNNDRGNIRTEYGDYGNTVDGGKHTEANKWMHVVMVTKGSTGEAWLYLDGVQIGYSDSIPADAKASALAAQNNWLGRSAWAGDVDYPAIFDQLQVYNAVLTAGEIQEICNKGYSEQVEKARETIAITSAVEGITYDKNNVIGNLNLPTQNVAEGITIEWSSSDNAVINPETGVVVRPAAGQGDKTVTLTAVVKAGYNVEETILTETVTVKEQEVTLNKEALENKIADALDKVKDTSYPEAARNELSAAIEAAQEVANNVNATQAEVDQAAQDLANAITKFENSKPVPPTLDKTALENKITDATEKVKDESYPETARNELNTAISTAQNVLANATTQKEIDDAVTALNTAISKFEDSKPDKSALSDKITDATEKVNDASIAYPEEARETLRAAIEAAQGVVNNVNATQAEVDQAAQDLEAAIKAFEATAPDKSKLASAITSAEKLDKSKYTSASWKPFQDALTKAKEINAKADATQKEIDDAYSALTKAQKALVKVVLVKSLSVTNSRTLKVFAGKKVTMKLQVNPTNATNKKVTWSISSSQQKYATVDSKGIVTTKKAGAGKTVTVTGKATDGSGKKIVVKLTLMKNAVKKVSFDAASKSVKAGNKITLKPTIKTNGKDVNKKLYWKVSNTKYATIDQKGVVTAKKAGKGKTVTVTARTTDGTQKVATIKIKIK